MSGMENNVRSYNEGSSDYAVHELQPWDIILAWKLTFFEGDLLKRLLRTKPEPGLTLEESRALDRRKMLHVHSEMVRQRDLGFRWEVNVTNIKTWTTSKVTLDDVLVEYRLSSIDASILSAIQKHDLEGLKSLLERALEE